MSPNVLARSGHKSPVLLVLAVAILLFSLWATWVARHNSSRVYRVHQLPSAIIDDSDIAGVRDAWLI